MVSVRTGILEDDLSVVMANWVSGVLDPDGKMAYRTSVLVGLVEADVIRSVRVYVTVCKSDSCTAHWKLGVLIDEACSA